MAGGCEWEGIGKRKSTSAAEKKRFLHFHMLRVGAASGVFYESPITNLSMKCVVF